MSATRDIIMEVARKAVQANGYSALSFRELAKAVGIKSASIHYHFPTKGGLAAALARHYTDEGIDFLNGLLAESRDQRRCMDAYVDIFRRLILQENRMCLCGMLAAEYGDLPIEARLEVDRFTDVNIRWLSQVLSLDKQPHAPEATRRKAVALFSAIQGAQLVARGRGGDVDIYDQTLEVCREQGLMP